MSATTRLAGVQREWRACRAIAMQAYYKRRVQGSNWLSFALLGLAVLAPVIAGLLSHKWMLSIGIGFGVSAAMFSFLWWTLLLASVTQQNFPGAYYLVPRMRARSLAVVAGTALLIVLTHVLLFGMAGVAPAITAALAILVLATVAACMWVPVVRHLLMVVVFGNTLFGKWIPPTFVALVGKHFLVGTALVLLLYAVLAKMQLRRRGPTPAPAVAIPASKPCLYNLALRRDCAGADKGRLLLHAGGPGGLATMSALPMLLVSLVAAIALPFFDADSPWIGGSRFLIVSAMILAHYFGAQRVIGAMLAHQAEQSLVRLAAAAPRAAQLNAVLGRALLRDFGLCWATTSAAALLFLASGGMDAVRLLGLGALFVMNLLTAGLLLRDYAQGAPDSGLVNVMSACYLIAAHAMALLLLSGIMGIAAVAVFLATAAGASATLLFVRWRRVVRLPVAFPAARR